MLCGSILDVSAVNQPSKYDRRAAARSFSCLGRQPTEQVRSPRRASENHKQSNESCLVAALSRPSTNRASTITCRREPLRSRAEVSAVNRPSKYDHLLPVEGHLPEQQRVGRDSSSRLSCAPSKPRTSNRRSRFPAVYDVSAVNQPSKYDHERRGQARPRSHRVSAVNQPSKYDRHVVINLEHDRSCLGRQPTEQVRSRRCSARARGSSVSAVNQPSKYDHSRCDSSGRPSRSLGRQPTEQVRSQQFEVRPRPHVESRPSTNRASTITARDRARARRSSASLGRQPTEQVRSRRLAADAIARRGLGRQPTEQVRSRCLGRTDDGWRRSRPSTNRASTITFADGDNVRRLVSAVNQPSKYDHAVAVDATRSRRWSRPSTNRASTITRRTRSTAPCGQSRLGRQPTEQVRSRVGARRAHHESSESRPSTNRASTITSWSDRRTPCARMSRPSTNRASTITRRHDRRDAHGTSLGRQPTEQVRSHASIARQCARSRASRPSTNRASTITRVRP